MTAFFRTSSQFLYFLSVLTAVPSLALLAWGVSSTARFLASAPFGLTLGEYAATAAVSTLTANAVAFLRPDDMAGWMGPFAGVLLLGFAGIMLLLFVLPL